MGLYNVIALGTELAVLSWYVAIPLANGCSSLLRDDYARFWEFRQSLAATAVLAVVRGACFVYVRLSSKRAPATRCFVFFVFLIQGLICALSALQPLVFWRDPSSFKRYRAYDWGADFVYTLAALTLLSSALQIVYVFQLNKNRGRLADDGLLGDVLLGETDAKLAVWQTKWSQLVKHIKRRQTDPTFEAIVRLYAQRDGAVERLKTEFDRDPTEFEFYLPQLCSFLLLGNYAQSPQLCMMLLEKCSVSHVFAHRMLWYLQSYCLKNAAFASEESTSRIQMLIDEVSSRGMKPAKASEKPAQATTCFSGSDEKTGAYSATIAPAASSEVEALLPSKEGEHYFTFTIKPPIDLERGNASVDPFQQESAFLSALAGVSSNLRTVPLTRRNDMLRTWLEDIQTQFLPSNSLYVPVGNWHHRIKRIHVTESFTFSTRERVPFLLCAEVVDYTTPEEDKKLGRKRSSIFRGRRFTLGLWEKAALSVRNHTLTSSSDRAPPTSPESGALGFWSESKPGASPRQRSASHPSDLWNGLLDTIVKKNPLSRNGSYNTPHHAKGTNQEALLSDSHPASPTASGYQKQRSLRHSTGTNTSKRSLTIDTSSGEKDERVSSDRREELWSPRSDGPLSPHSPSSPYLARCDSTDMFLRTLSERDSKEVDDEESALPPLASGRADVPAVIFKERWSEKENRVRGSSPWSSSPGWRLLPVIVKSDDDLRQEQLASQMIKQFSKVFADAKLPVFMRPYDVIAISGTSGLVEAIADTISIDSLKRNDPEYTTLLDFFYRHFGDESSSEFRMARNNFVSSMAAYSIVCYLLQIKDRHNGNILLDAEGHIIHIDFGFMLANNPGNVGFEQAPFKLTAEFVELMGGPRSASFRRFRSLCVRAFLVARKYRHRFTLLLEMMINGNENLPCFAGDPRGAIDRLAARFQPQLDINACEDFVHALIDASLDNWRTKWYDKYQRWCVGVF